MRSPCCLSAQPAIVVGNCSVDTASPQRIQVQRQKKCWKRHVGVSVCPYIPLNFYYEACITTLLSMCLCIFP
jgi:hypothetical protein